MASRAVSHSRMGTRGWGIRADFQVQTLEAGLAFLLGWVCLRWGWLASPSLLDEP